MQVSPHQFLLTVGQSLWTEFQNQIFLIFQFKPIFVLLIRGHCKRELLNLVSGLAAVCLHLVKGSFTLSNSETETNQYLDHDHDRSCMTLKLLQEESSKLQIHGSFTLFQCCQAFVQVLINNSQRDN